MTTTFTVGTDGKARIEKRKAARLDFSMNWASWLAPLVDTIASVVWTSSAGLTLTGPTNTTTTASVFVSGGSANIQEWLTCTITTASSPTARIDSRTVYLDIIDR